MWCSHRPCSREVFGPSAFCYYHGKVHAGLITTTRLWDTGQYRAVELSDAEREEAAENRAAYYASLWDRVTGDPFHDAWDFL